MPLQTFPVLEVPGIIIAFDDTWNAPRPGGGHHQGVDIVTWEAPLAQVKSVPGSPVVAVDDGELTDGTNPAGGNSLWVVGADGQAWYYAHLLRFEGTVPRTVQTGDVIGYVGMSGDAQGTLYHLHFGSKPSGKSGAWVDPYSLLKTAPRVQARSGEIPGEGSGSMSRPAVLFWTGLAAVSVVGGFWLGLRLLDRAAPRPRVRAA